MRSMSINELRKAFSYDPLTGLFSWLISTNRCIHIGDEAGTTKPDGYVYLYLNNLSFLAHRVAWALHYGCWPAVPLDHRNTTKNDNRIDNFRLASVTENNRNRPKQSNNTSGYKGVTFNKAAQKYHAKIMRDKKCISLGYFNDPIEASIAYKNAAKEYHHEFARF